VTGDVEGAVALGRLPQALIQQFEGKLKAGLLLRFKIGPGGFYLSDDGCIVGADLQLVGVANQARKADKYSRIVFQWQMRAEQVDLQHLVDRMNENELGTKQ
jgi:hypothetical protein